MADHEERALPTCHGVLTRAQALEAGLTAAQIGWRLRSRQWRQLHKEVYLAGTHEGFLTKLSAAVSATEGVASERSAAVLWKMDGFQGESSIDITAPERSQLASVSVHVARLDPRLIRRCEGIPVTSPARTLVDLGRWVHMDVVEWAMDFCLRKKMTSWRDLDRLLSAEAGRGRRGPAVLRTILGLRGKPRRYTDSQLETEFFQLMRYARLRAPRLQYPLPVMEGTRRVPHADFAWPDANLLVETVGHGAHALERRQFRRDARRSTAINRLRRFAVFSFTWEDVHFEQHAVCEIVAEALGIRWQPSAAVTEDIAAFAARLAAAHAAAKANREETPPTAASG